MTERLYYANSCLRQFEATIVAVRREGDRNLVALDQTAFYPSSGGQPNDTGTLGEWRVVDVTVEDGVVWHTVEADRTPETGRHVRGKIDWPRRYDHMQQHTGQHLLSQVFERLYGYETIAVHMGAVENTLDLDTPTLDEDQLLAAESEACDRVHEALPVRTYVVDEADLAAVPLRRPPKVSGSIRIVEIEKYDYSACGGTHCGSTAEAGPIKIVGTERRRGSVRVTFLCGRRAFEDYQLKHRLLAESASLYSSHIAQVPVLAARNQDLVKELQRRVVELTGRLLLADAVGLLAGAEPLPRGGRLVSALRDDLDANALRALASALIETPGTVALIASQQAGKVLLVFARNSEGSGNMGSLLHEVLQGVGGKGGGRPDFAQGGGVDAAFGAALLERARLLIVEGDA